MRKRLFAAAACAFLLAATGVFGQSFRPFVVKDIRVEGLQRTEAGTVFSYLPVKVGGERVFLDQSGDPTVVSEPQFSRVMGMAGSSVARPPGGERPTAQGRGPALLLQERRLFARRGLRTARRRSGPMSL